MESLSLNLPSFPPRPQSHSLAATGQARPSSSVLDIGRWDRQATSLHGLHKPSCVNSPCAARWLLGAVSPACTNCSALSPRFPSAGPWDLSHIVVTCPRLPVISQDRGRRMGRNQVGCYAGAWDPRDSMDGSLQRVARSPAIVCPGTDLLSFALRMTPGFPWWPHGYERIHLPIQGTQA